MFKEAPANSQVQNTSEYISYVNLLSRNNPIFRVNKEGVLDS